MREEHSVCFDRWKLHARQPGGRFPGRISHWRSALILLAVLSLTVSVATRYCYVTGSEIQALRAVKSNALDGKRQHLLNDGLHWAAPAATFVFFEPAEVSAALPRDIPPLVRLYSENCLYDRPPPAC